MKLVSSIGSCLVAGALLVTPALAEKTEIYDTLILRGDVCTITIESSPSLTVCAGQTQTFTAEVVCSDGFEQVAEPTWLVDGSQVGMGATIDLSFTLGSHVVTAHCGSCTDVVSVEAIDCVTQPILNADFSNDDTEATTGVFMSPNLAPVIGANFSQLVFNMRPFSLDKDPSLSSGTMTLDVVGSNIDLYEPDGSFIVLPATYDVADLPVDFLANATDFGEASVTASYTARAGTPTTDEVLVRVGPFPGASGEPLSEYPFYHYVDTFDTTRPIHSNLDADRHAERDGFDYDVYVVEHKTAAGWAFDNTLTDVTGSVETATFDAGGSNVVAAWSAGLDPGTLVSKSYDVVLDFGQDGTLDPGDIIDKLTLDDLAAGAYVVKDLTTAGPYAVSDDLYSGGTFLGQKVYWPTNIASLGELPLVIMSHGNGHNYTWYDYLGEHMASHGYIYMSHQNNTGPGIETASTTTLTNTDYILGNLGTIAGGVLNGHVDLDRIIWSGHSRGGEGVARAYDRLFDGTFVPSNYTIDQIVLVSSIAPTVFLGATTSDPHDANYHVIGAAGDGDVSGAANCSICQYFRLADRAEGVSQTMYVQGADHNDFNCCGFNDYQGPASAQIGRAEAQEVAKGYYLALGEYWGKDNPATKEYLTRMYDDIHPLGIDVDTEVALSWMERDTPGNFVIDDFESNGAENTSSSGGSVTFDVSNYDETDNEDTNTTFTWLASDPMNGNIYHSDGGDVSSGSVFDYTVGQQRFVEFEIIAGSRDIRGYSHVSFRAAQGTRHPETVAHGDDHSFSVTLRDGSGTSSTIHFGSWGELSPLFQRTGQGSGAGWANEYHTVRIPVPAFEDDGSGIDLSDVVAVRLEFGSSFGSDRGRISIDDVQLMLE